MIKSILFDGKEGYIGSRYTVEDKPEKPSKNDHKFNYWDWNKKKDILNEEKYNKCLDRYNEEMAFYRAHKGKYKVDCSKYLVGRTFTFDADRINLIFGPNASGKSTILKGIASHAMCEDGFSKFAEVIDLIGFGIDNFTVDDYMEGIKRHILKMGGTSSVVEWDGSPIYYHNFDNRKTYGYIGDLCGSIIDSVGEEILYTMDKNSSSSGQGMFYQFSKLVGRMSKSVTYEDILEGPKKEYGRRKEDDCWRMCYDAQERYYKSFPMSYDRNGQNTYLFDEIDKSMDILNINELYTKILPSLSERYGKQIIIISHSPLVLRDEVYKSEKYNFISIDEEYTEKCRKLLF